MADKKSDSTVNESRMSYDENCSERIHPKIAKQLRERNTTLGAHPIFPDSDEAHFEEKIMSKRFAEVVNNYKRQFDTENADPMESMMMTQKLVGECMKLEAEHKKSLEELAVEMIRKEYDMGEDDVEIIAELTTNVNLEGMRQNPSP